MHKNILVHLFLLSFLLRLAVFLPLFFIYGAEIFFTGDSYSYYNTAKNLLAGNGYSFTNQFGAIIPYDFRPPLYPFLIAGSLFLTGGITALLLAQILFSSFIPVLTYLLGKEFLVDKKSVLVASIVAVVEPLLLVFSSYLLTDSLFLLFFLGALFYSVRIIKEPKYHYAVWIGLGLGLASLLRGIGEYFILYLGIFLAWSFLKNPARRGMFLKTYAFSVLVFAIIIAPWTARNIVLFGNPSVSSEGPWVIYFDYIPSLYSIKEGISFTEARARVKEKLRISLGVSEKTFTTHVDSRILLRESIPLILEEARIIPKLQLINAVWFFTHDNYAWHLGRFGILGPRPAQFSSTLTLVREGLGGIPKILDYARGAYGIPILGRIIWSLISLTAFIGAYFLFRERRETLIIVFLLGAIFYYYLLSSSIGLAGEGRIRIPISPILFLLAAHGSLVLWRKTSARLKALS